MIRSNRVQSAIALGIGVTGFLLFPAEPSASQPVEQQDRDTASAKAQQLNEKARDLFKTGQQEDAAEKLAELWRLNQEALGNDDSETIASLRLYASVLKVLGRTDEAATLSAEAWQLSRKRQGDDHWDTLGALNEYASTLLTLGRIEEAAQLLSRTESSFHEPLAMDHPQQLADLNFDALVKVNSGQIPSALGILDEALRLSRAELGERHPATLKLMNNRADALRQALRTEEMIAVLAEVMQLRSEVLGQRDPATLQSVSRYASALLITGDAATAEPLLAQVLQFTREDPLFNDDSPRTLISVNQYAGALLKLGRVEDAEQLLTDATQPYPQEAPKTQPADEASFARLVMLLQGRFDELEPIEAEALRQSRATFGDRDPQTLAQISNYAALITQLGRMEEASGLFEESLTLSREVLGERHPATLNALKNFGGALLQLGKLERAEAVLASSMKLHGEVLGERDYNTIHSIENYALVLFELGRVEEAEVLAARALQQRREFEGDDRSSTFISRAKYATILLGSDKPEEAAPVARAVSNWARSRTLELDDQGLRGQAQSGRDRADRQFLERLLADALWSANSGSPNTRSKNKDEAFTALQLASAGSTNRAVAEAAAARFAAGVGVAEKVRERQELSRQWVQIESALARMVAGESASSDVREEIAMQLAAAEARMAELDQALSDTAPEYFAIQRQQAIEIDALRSVMAKDEAILMLVPTARGTHAMAVTKTEVHWVRADVNAAELGLKVKDFRESIEVKPGMAVLPLFDLETAHNLHAILIEPVADALDGKARVFVVADGALSRIPLGALLTEPPQGDAFTDDPEVLRSVPWLADRYPLVQIPSLQSLYFIRRFSDDSGAPQDPGYVGFGDPVLGGANRMRGTVSGSVKASDAAGFIARGAGGGQATIMDPEALSSMSSLPGTRVEIEEVRTVIGAPRDSVSFGNAMTETALRKTDLSRVRILHLATHGLTSEESGTLAEPGLVFTPPADATLQDDGYLAASEVVGLNLNLAEWVILSACNTAAPSGRVGETGLTGLAKAFFYAGTRSMLVSHWPVYDDIAPLLTLKTLEKAQAGEGRAEALQAAMREIRMDPALDAAHPAVWAPFTLVGEGGES